ncbi:TetR/AcrR family transcriptional regulator [Cellulomonas sp. P22]|uniref:TetR/AcrR family transcriptional regulator n=1 Tax=Cellulomonas sp. P22 TaxID=3373189 RepID=UPI0037A9C96D
MTPTSRPRRAAPLAPAERRAAVLDATIPLLREQGFAVTTRQIAAAAGVAEGTLFRVFPDKDAILRAAMDQALDPGPVVEAIAAIPATTPLREALVEAVAHLQARHQLVASLLVAAHRAPREHEPDAARTVGHPHGHPGRGHRGVFIEALSGALVGLLAPHAAELRRPPADCAHVLIALVLSAGAGPHRPRPAEGSDVAAPSFTPREVVDVLLDGLARPMEA